MDIIQAVILGILQGITEWLPISSSGQVMLSLIEFLDVNAESAFALAIALHIGTMLAVVVKYRNDIFDIIKKLSWKDNLTRFIIVSTVFTGAIGIPVYFLLKSVFAYGELANGLIGILLIITGIILYISKKIKLGSIDVSSLGYKEMAVAGAAQGISILPGISRSGTTIAAMLMMGIRQDIALKLSFLMSIPAVIGALVLDFSDFVSSDFGIMQILAGITAAFIFGYLTMDVLVKIAHKIRFDIFCIFFGIIAILAFLL